MAALNRWQLSSNHVCHAHLQDIHARYTHICCTNSTVSPQERVEVVYDEFLEEKGVLFRPHISMCQETRDDSQHKGKTMSLFPCHSKASENSSNLPPISDPLWIPIPVPKFLL
ncbi:hypothetical protein GOBAR_DD02821 [Gossypium barbadense]|nr:hypothetical protein GOBAR_DD02821 [Gossypium barbadense]